MKRKRIDPDLGQFPEELRRLLEGVPVWDSSCSPQAKVYYIERDGGMYLKTAPRGSLGREARMDQFFFRKGLGPQVLTYLEGERDWLLTARIPGEDCTWQPYLDDPKRLSEKTAQLLRSLHEADGFGCPVPDRTGEYLAKAAENYAAGVFDGDLFPDNWGYRSAEEAWNIVQTQGKYLKSDTLLHGDYCLPNILLDNWNFTGFIDLDTAGMGDRHVDLFWGTWTLQFNLKTDRYRDRFLDAYGREAVDEELLRVVAAIEVFG